MKTQSILSTNNFSLFVPHEYQQPMVALHVKRLAEKMKKNGYRVSKPISVYRRADGKLVVIDGHHRLAAAQLAGCFAYYVIEKEEVGEQIGDINEVQRVWCGLSFAKFHAGHGNKDYATLLNYVERGLPLNVAGSLLSGESAHSGNANRKIKTGVFKVKTTKSADTILDLFEKLGDLCPEVESVTYITAISLMLPLKEFQISTLIQRAKANPRALVKCATRQQALGVLEEVYNFRSQIKYNLAFLAEEAARNRAAAIGFRK
jgi:hypothetical protein